MIYPLSGIRKEADDNNLRLPAMTYPKTQRLQRDPQSGAWLTSDKAEENARANRLAPHINNGNRGTMHHHTDALVAEAPALRNLTGKQRAAYSRAMASVLNPDYWPATWSPETVQAVQANMAKKLLSPKGKGGWVGPNHGYAGPQGTFSHGTFVSEGATDNHMAVQNFGTPDSWLPGYDPTQKIRERNAARRAVGLLPSGAQQSQGWWGGKHDFLDNMADDFKRMSTDFKNVVDPIRQRIRESTR